MPSEKPPGSNNDRIDFLNTTKMPEFLPDLESSNIISSEEPPKINDGEKDFFNTNNSKGEETHYESNPKNGGLDFFNTTVMPTFLPDLESNSHVVTSHRRGFGSNCLNQPTIDALMSTYYFSNMPMTVVYEIFSYFEFGFSILRNVEDKLDELRPIDEDSEIDIKFSFSKNGRTIHQKITLPDSVAKPLIQNGRYNWVEGFAYISSVRERLNEIYAQKDIQFVYMVCRKVRQRIPNYKKVYLT
jgi:hypothetical protein